MLIVGDPSDPVKGIQAVQGQHVSPASFRLTAQKCSYKKVRLQAARLETEDARLQRPDLTLRRANALVIYPVLRDKALDLLLQGIHKHTDMVTVAHGVMHLYG